MTFEEILDQAIAMLQRRGRVTYRTLKRQFQLDDDALEDLKAELIYGRQLAVDEDGRVLVWTGGPGRRRLRGVPLVWDFQHVLEKLWATAYAFYGKGTPKAWAWVQERAWRLLHGEVSRVVQGMRLSATKRHLGGQRRQVVEAAVGYLYRNRRHMRYDEYLRRGWPIATGVVEGACKNLLKDRMERSGMRRTRLMAEAMLKLRAVCLSGGFEEYWAFYVRREHERLYPSSSWRPVSPIEQK
jgi:hypothetical protein